MYAFVVLFQKIIQNEKNAHFFPIHFALFLLSEHSYSYRKKVSNFNKQQQVSLVPLFPVCSPMAIDTPHVCSKDDIIVTNMFINYRLKKIADLRKMEVFEMPQGLSGFFNGTIIDDLKEMVRPKSKKPLLSLLCKVGNHKR